MGFNLKVFFTGLREILNQEELSDLEILDMIDSYVEHNEQYAKDCGLINE